MQRRQFLQTAVRTFLYYSLPKIRGVNDGTSQNRQIALTFDDGPRPQILDRLLPLFAAHEIPATFFIIGIVAFSQQKMLKHIHGQGYEIENHSWDHENMKHLFAKKGLEGVRASIKKTENLIREITGRKPHFFRPPFWVLPSNIEIIIQEMDYTIMKLGNPDINTYDYDDVFRKRQSVHLVERIKSLLQSREKAGVFNHILVFHEHFLTVEALKTLIPFWKEIGYEFVRLDVLFP